MSLYAGVDGGGSKTRVMIVDTSSGRGATLTGPPCNPNTVGWPKACHNVVQLIREGLTGLGAAPAALVAISAGVAGVDRPDEAEKWRSELRVCFPSAAIEVVNDALPVLAAGTEGASGVALIAGTGSIAVGEDDHGRVARAGGFGYLLGDEGSGFDIGRRGLMAAIQGYEGRGPRTRLWDAAAEAFQLSRPADLIAKVYQSSHPVGVVASFARWVLRFADEDAVAEAIVKQAIHHLTNLVESVFTQLQDRVAPNVVLSGGLLTHSDALVEGLKRAHPEKRLMVLRRSAAAGAVLRALKLTASRQEAASGLPQVDVDRWRRMVDGIEGS